MDEDSSMHSGHVAFTALHLAAEAGHLPVVRRLLAGGASLALFTSQEDCAASLALREGHLEVVKALLEAAEDEEEKGLQLARVARRLQTGFHSGAARTGMLPFSLLGVAEEREQLARLVQRLVQGLVEGGSQAAAAARAAPSTAVAQAAAGSSRLLAHLLAAGASVSRVDPPGGFPLLHSCWFGWPAMQRLLEAGADPNQASPSTQQTALQLLAAQPALAPEAEGLLAWPGVDLRQVDAAGFDALGLAIGQKNRRFAEALLAWLVHLPGKQQQDHQQQEQERQEVGNAASRLYDVLQGWQDFSSLATINQLDATGAHILVKQASLGGGRWVVLPADARSDTSTCCLLCVAARR